MTTATKLAELARANQKVVTSTNAYEEFEKKVEEGSKKYVEYVIAKCTELAIQGYGSVYITIDRTTDMFHKDEGRNSCYSADYVCALLYKNGFMFDHTKEIDLYDVLQTKLVWDNNLPSSKSCIGMRWE